MSDKINWTPETIAKLRAVCEAATPGPWTDSGATVASDAERDENDMPYVVVEPYCRPGDRVFMETARTALPAALDEIERRGREIVSFYEEATIANLSGPDVLAKTEVILRNCVRVQMERVSAYERERDEACEQRDNLLAEVEQLRGEVARLEHMVADVAAGRL